MEELFEQILVYLKGIWNKRWYAMIIIWLISIVGWGYVYKMSDQYESKARIYIDTQSLLKPLLSGLTVEIDVYQQINLMVKTLFSRPNVEKMIRMTDMDLAINNQDEMDALVSQLKSSIKFKLADRGDNLYNLSYVDSNKARAKEVLESVLTVFVENSIGQSQDDVNSAKNFLNKQIKLYENRLLDAENQLKEFKQKNIGLLPSSGQDYYSRMQDSYEQLETAKLQLREAEQQLQSIEAEVEGEVPSFGLGPSNTLTQSSTSYDSRIEELEINLDNLLLQYTHSHPDVLAVRRVLNNLNKQRDKERAEMQIANMNSNYELDQNPVFQQLKINLGESRVQVDTLKVRVKEYTARYEKLKGMVNTMPEIEAQLKALNRDYDVNKQQYDEFIARKESASITESIDQTTDGIQFKIIEAPRVEHEPVGPPRILWTSLIFVLALGAGIALAFILAQLKPVVSSAGELARLTGLPLFGTVSAITSPGQRRRRTIMVMSYFSLLTILLVVYGLLVTWYTMLLNA